MGLRTRKFYWAMIAVSALFASMVFWRTGFVPIASGGDDVWFSESGYWFLKEGTLRRPMHQNPLRSDLRDFLPPIPSLAQAASFSAFGVNQFSMAIGPSIVTVLLVASVVMFGHHLGALRTIAACSGLAIFAIPESFQRSIQSRYDIYVALFVMLSVACLDLARLYRRPLFFSAAGAWICLSVIAYYPSAILAIIFIVLLIKWRIYRDVGIIDLASFLGGGLLPAIIFLVWIGSDLPWMLQYLSAAGQSYDSTGRLLRVAGNLRLMPWSIVFLFVLNSTILGLLWGQGGYRGDLARATCAAALSCGLIMPVTSHALLPAMATLTVLAILFLVSLDSRARVLVAATCLLLPGACTALAGATYSAMVLSSQEGRHIEPFGSQLRATINTDGLVLVDNPGWLPLRQHLPKGKLVHIAGYSPDASRADASAFFFDPQSSARISTVAIVPGTQYRLAVFPTIIDFLHRADVEGPIIVGQSMPYQLEVYRKKQ
jgi:hypothetical protein